MSKTSKTTVSGFGLVNKATGKPMGVIYTNDSYQLVPYIQWVDCGEEFFVDSLEQAEIVVNYSTPYYNTTKIRPTHTSKNLELQIVQVTKTITRKEIETHIYKKINFMFVSDANRDEINKLYPYVKPDTKLYIVYSSEDIDIEILEKVMVGDKIMYYLGKNTDENGRIRFYCETER